MVNDKIWHKIDNYTGWQVFIMTNLLQQSFCQYLDVIFSKVAPKGLGAMLSEKVR